MGLSSEEKERFLRALEEDWEFRYAVMGLLGVQELIKAVAALTNEVAGLKERVGKLEDRVDGLAKEVTALRQDFNVLKQDVEYLKAKVDSLEKGQEGLRKDMGEVKERLNKLDRTVENLTLGLEAEANSLVSNYLRRRGINIDTDRVQLDYRYEFGIYGSNGQVTIVGEAKIRVSAAIIDRVVERVKEAVKLFPDKFPGRVIIVAYCMRHCRTPWRKPKN
ncbi:hypothetical protein [Vulcanisaeta sp. JCM 14467]|uniref:hypothetical protein n=1 Tax=Vulcanisaeta sp. JCM 14467 TaxID=1295370 RepID=UPI0006D25F7E|nr:hypothetical protein [Vulcanisaeta sp. JCM 14467]